MITQHFTQLDTREVHFRRAGRGPAVVALHPSPMSSSALLPLMISLSDTHCVLAPDTPGYGLSPPDPDNPNSASEFALSLKAWVDAVGLTRFALYGSATGAQIALEFAKRYPERIERLVLDNAAHFEDAARTMLLERYFPDLSPRASGAHLADLWHFNREISTFFPWFAQSAEARLPRELPPLSALHATAIDTMRAGAGYDRAYRAAVSNEHGSRYRDLCVPTTLIRWLSSLLIDQIDALIAYGLPACVRVADAAPDERFAAIRHALEGDWTEPPPAVASEHRFQRVRDGHLHVRMTTRGSQRPHIRLHAPGESMAADVFLADDRPCLRVDLPLHGESAGDFVATREGLVGPVAEVARELGFIDATVGGACSSLVDALVAELPGASATPCAGFEAIHEIDLSPSWDGTHLLRAWRVARERGLFAPVFGAQRRPIVDSSALDLRTIEQRCLAAVQAGAHYAAIMRAV